MLQSTFQETNCLAKSQFSAWNSQNHQKFRHHLDIMEKISQYFVLRRT